MQAVSAGHAQPAAPTRLNERGLRRADLATSASVPAARVPIVSVEVVPWTDIEREHARRRACAVNMVVVPPASAPRHGLGQCIRCDSRLDRQCSARHSSRSSLGSRRKAHQYEGRRDREQISRHRSLQGSPVAHVPHPELSPRLSCAMAGKCSRPEPAMNVCELQSFDARPRQLDYSPREFGTSASQPERVPISAEELAIWD